MSNSLKRFITTLFLCALYIYPAITFSQSSNDYKRVSLAFYGGVTLSHPDNTSQIIGSNFNTFTQTTYNFGGGLQYAISPFWSTEIGYRYNSIEGIENDGFETKMHSAVLKNIFNLNRLYRRNRISNWLNPFIIIGAEQDFYTFRSEIEENSGNESALLAGLGVAISVSNSIDFFTQYEIKLASNKIDNINSGFPFDQIGLSTAGIRINFGRKGSKPMNLSPATKSLSDGEYDNFIVRSDELKETAEEIQFQSLKITDLEEKYDESGKNYREEIKKLNEFTRLLESRIDTLKNRLDNLDLSNLGGIQDNEQVLKSEVSAGHYVQVFATLNYDTASRVRDKFQGILNREIENSVESVFVIKRGNFYEVLIGSFTEYDDAQSVHEIAVGVFSDAFIITFPRPLHLEESYRDTRKVID